MSEGTETDHITTTDTYDRISAIGGPNECLE